ncbi:hypothetical protein AOXY_G38601 [Acipenser oxyrinchus oxyrinchus]|uniref:Uncharacterized protein n=1 Tax=Acipenser oxyrinchus oxyrinchus TaxID=40147 RepID=A0AAD8CDU4_ACIOX|nr:hypothetical protein AOXY_G38601 [Acipenser oxyrinchus oxyrinchus]
MKKELHPVPSWTYTIRDHLDTDFEGNTSDIENRDESRDTNTDQPELCSVNSDMKVLVSTEQKPTRQGQINGDMSEEGYRFRLHKC